MSYKVDFHTHSTASPDGSLQLKDYQYALQNRRLDSIAVTDHNTVDQALLLQAELGDRIIVGEEITTLQGEIIGLYLTQTIPPLLDIQVTIQAIKAQGGLVYIPHPFETVRGGVREATLEAIAGDVDIVEIQNGRAVFQNLSKRAADWALRHSTPGVASSDAHGKKGWGRTYTVLHEMPTRDTLVALLSEGTINKGFPGLIGILYPKVNRIRKRNHYA